MFWSNFKKGNIFNLSDGKPQLFFCEQYLQRKKSIIWVKKNINGEVKKRYQQWGEKKKDINGEVKKHINFLGNFFINLPSNTNFVSKF